MQGVRTLHVTGLRHEALRQSPQYRPTPPRPASRVGRLERSHAELRTRGAAAPILEEAITSPPSENPEKFDDTAPQPARDLATERFNWLRAWYPIAAVYDLDPSRPHAVQLLGKKLVLWRDSFSTWQCFEDLCPHRLAPLSEGRLHEGDGTLTCAYHGWRFNGAGQCTLIPQINDDRAQNLACSSKRSCVAAFPTQEKNGLLWVWPDASDRGKAEAARTATCAPPEHDESSQKLLWLSHWFVRDVPYGFESLAENIMDPSHVQFSHHKVIGHRGANWNYNMKLDGKVEPQTGFTVKQLTKQLTDNKGKPRDNPKERESKIQFQPPCLVQAAFPGPINMVTYSTPLCEGRSRLFFGLSRPEVGAPAAMKLALSVANLPWLRWKGHMRQSNVLDGDNVFLHGQDVALAQGDQTPLQRYYMPASADGAVSHVRRWFADMAQAVPWAPGSTRYAPSAKREELLDRFHTHTQHCKSCSQAFKAFSWMSVAVLAVAALSAVYATASLAAGAHWRAARVLSTAALAVGGSVLGAGLRSLRQKLVFVDYVHADHH